jgi:hypothetical protein
MLVVPYARMTLAPALFTLIPFLAAPLFHSIFMVLDALTNTRAALRVLIGMRLIARLDGLGGDVGVKIAR